MARRVTGGARRAGLETEFLEVTLDLSSLALSVLDKRTGLRWETLADGAQDVIHFRKGLPQPTSLCGRAGEVRRLSGRERGLALKLRGIPAEIHLLFTEREDEVEVRLVPQRETAANHLRGAVYPRPWAFPARGDAYTVLPLSRGFLIPGNWPVRYWNLSEPEVLEDYEERMARWGEIFHGRPFGWWDFDQLADGRMTDLGFAPCQSWWGFVEPEGALLSYVHPDQADHRFEVRHAAGGPTEVVNYWISSHQRLRYPRRIVFRFLEEADYVRLAKEYRGIISAVGYTRSLEDKAKVTPRVNALAGEIMMRAQILQHDFRRFAHQVRQSFDDVAQKVLLVRQHSGWDRVTVHLRGWQKLGHDIQYPDVLPPNVEAGGPAGIGRLSDTVRDCGYTFELGGCNYHDVTVEAESFSPRHVLILSDGSMVRRNFWAGGLVSFFCPREAIKFVKRNMEIGRTDYPVTQGLLELARPHSYWIGNYARHIECFSREHPMTRQQCKDAQRATFDYLRSCGLITSTEHYVDWLMPHVDRGRGRVMHRGQGNVDADVAEPVGIPVPLWQLVFHDCGILSGGASEREFLDSLLMGAAAGAGLPDSPEFFATETFQRALVVAKVHRAVAFQEMTNHEFLSADRARQRTTFADGTTVEVDFGRGTYQVKGVDLK
jgi:hypothetical protein